MSPHPELQDVHLLLDRTNEQIIEFKTLLRAFLDKEAWSVSVDFDIERSQYVHKVIIGRQPSGKIKIAAKDAWGNLRSTLDHLNAACARLGGASGHDKQAHFPFAGCVAKLDRTIKDRCRNIPEPVKDYFKSLRPYKGGDDCLHALTSIRNSNEHWKLRSALFRVDTIRIFWPETQESKIIPVRSGPRPMHGQRYT